MIQRNWTILNLRQTKGCHPSAIVYNDVAWTGISEDLIRKCTPDIKHKGNAGVHFHCKDIGTLAMDSLEQFMIE